MKKIKIDLFSQSREETKLKRIYFRKIILNKDGTGKILIFKNGINIDPEANNKKGQTTKVDEEENFERSIRRTKKNIKDIVYNNDFDYFTTFTFKRDSENKYNRIDITKTNNVMPMFKNFIKKIHMYQKRNNMPMMKYLMIFEKHKDGVIHLHAFLKNVPPAYLSDSGRRDGSKKIYNVKGWPHGFSTAVPLVYADIDSKAKMANYITKYVSKDLEINFEKNERRYYCSTGLSRARILYNFTKEQLQEIELTDIYENEFYKDNEDYKEYYISFKKIT